MAFNLNVFEEVREQVLPAEYAAETLEVRSHYYNGEPATCVCPICGSGEGPHGTAALTLNPHDPHRWYCFAHGGGGDIFDLVGAVNGTDNKNEQLALAAEWAHLDLDGLKRPTLQARMQMAYNRQKRLQEQERKAARLQSVWEMNRLTEEAWLKAHQDMPFSVAALEYLASRGIDEATAKRWRLGYDPLSERIVIPYKGSTYYHADRDITGKAYRHKYDKPKFEQVGSEPLWNPQALNSDLVVVVEGQFDALAVGDVGFEAIACGGVGLAPMLSEIKARGGYGGTVCLMFDADKAGSDATGEAMSKLSSLEVSFAVLRDYPDGIKDPFEWWQHDAHELMLAINRAVS